MSFATSVGTAVMRRPERLVITSAATTLPAGGPASTPEAAGHRAAAAKLRVTALLGPKPHKPTALSAATCNLRRAASQPTSDSQ